MSRATQVDLAVGDRIELLEMDDPFPIEVGSKGTVRALTPCCGGLHVDVDWDSGRGLNLILPHDKYRLIERSSGDDDDPR